MRRLLQVGLGGLLGACALAAWMGRLPVVQATASDDEAPIYVKNGSLLLELGDSTMANRGAWVPDAPTPAGYLHDPAGAGQVSDSQALYVKVVTPPNVPVNCSSTPPVFSGNQVGITYSNNVRVTLHRQGSGTRMRTRVSPANRFANPSGSWLLTHADPNPAAKGHIEEVQVGGNRCTFNSAAELTHIVVCAGSRRPECR